MASDFYVYTHHRVTDGSIFYVGKGKGQRSRVVHGRSERWQRAVAKYGIEIQIVATGLTSHCACSFERALIASLDRAKLVNLTGGGDGAHDLDEESRQKMRLAKLGRKQSPEHASKSRSNKIGKKHPQSAIEALRKRRSIAVKSSEGEVFASATEAARQMSRRTGLAVNQGNLTMAASGHRKTAYGLGWSYA